MGAEVTLIAGPVALPTPVDVNRVDVRSAAQMLAAVMDALAGQDIYIGAAAVADYTPATVADKKIKKTAADLPVALERTTDISATVAASSTRPFGGGFPPETHQPEH